MVPLCFRSLLAIVVAAVGSIEAQTTSFFEQFEEVTKPALMSFGAIEKCGEGSTRGIKACVQYFNCDARTNTIISSENYDGSGLIDIRYRIGENKCDHPLDVCCDVPKGGIPPGVRLPVQNQTQVPVTTPKPNPAPTLSYCGIRNTNGIDFRITGNTNEAEFGEFPWMVALLLKDYNPSGNEPLSFCGGSLITPNVVLTGAHCVHRFPESSPGIKVRVGEWDTQTTRERLPYQERDVSRIIVHENFGPKNLFNDVALLILASPVDNYAHIGTICLPSQDFRFSSKECFATGWGKDVFEKEGVFQVILKKIQLPIVSHASCENSLRKTRLGVSFNLHSSFICAGGEPGKDTCTGDGGSPLVCPDPTNPSRYLQTGIVAWGIGCGENGIPGVYADVSQFRRWIDNQLTRLNINTKPYAN